MINTGTPTLQWLDGTLRLIDQTKIPDELVFFDATTVQECHDAIKRLVVRGAPAIGVSASYGVLLGLDSMKDKSPELFYAEFVNNCEYLATSRPTAVNLFWAINRMRSIAKSNALKPATEQYETLLKEAVDIEKEDKKSCRLIGKYGAELLDDGAIILTHCNAGALATVDYGTALAVVYAHVEQGKKIHVYADETRPLLQGSRLTSWELMDRNIPVTLICDGMAATVIRDKGIDAIVVGADRIAANGDVANKIGTYGLGILARYHAIPFYVAAPASTIDFDLADGSLIPIEERDPEEVRQYKGTVSAPPGVDVYNPAFDITPTRLIDAIITDYGVFRPPFHKTLLKLRHEIK